MVDRAFVQTNDLTQFLLNVIPLARDSMFERLNFLSLIVHCCLWRGQLQIWMKPIDFKSPEAETLVLNRLPCQPLCNLARVVVFTADGVWDETLLVMYVLRPPEVFLCAAAYPGICVAHRGGEIMTLSKQVKLTVDDFWRPY